MDHLEVECVQEYGVLPVLLSIPDLVQLNDHPGPGRGLGRHDARVDGGVVLLLLTYRLVLR